MESFSLLIKLAFSHFYIIPYILPQSFGFVYLFSKISKKRAAAPNGAAAKRLSCLAAAAAKDKQRDDDDPNDVVVKKVAKTVVHIVPPKINSKWGWNER